VGLRADEESREGLYGNYARYRFPLREWGWKLDDVQGYLKTRGIVVPTRTDCALCPYQRLGEWWRLWRDHIEEYEVGEAYEMQTGHTFRSPSRDIWPAGLTPLRAEFEKGRRPRGVDDDDGEVACRVCSL
jgi:hypothetical protein